MSKPRAMVQPQDDALLEKLRSKDPLNEGDEPLMSFDGPKFFASSKYSMKSPDKAANPNGQDVYELLNYYRTRCAEFDQERKEYIDRFASIEVR